MSYQVLARKWRPRNFAEMVGQAHVVRALANALDNDRLHHAYLFTGTRGVGKTTLARILSKSLNCEQGVSSRPCGECGTCREIDEGRFADLLEIDAASKTGVDDTRELLENVPYAPVRGRYKVYLIDEVHMFSGHSFNALLKTLEEPPPHVKFLLATTDPQKVPVTVLSRCLQFSLKRLPMAEIEAQMVHILDAEGIEFERDALTVLARSADGSMRDGLSLLEQAIAHGAGRVTADDVRAMLGVTATAGLPALVLAAHEGRGKDLIAAIDDIATSAPDFATLLRDVVTSLHRIGLLQQVPGAAQDTWADTETLNDVAARIPPADLQLYLQIALNGQRDLPLAPDDRSGFEMVMLRMLAFRPDAPAAAATGTRAGRATEAGPPAPQVVDEAGAYDAGPAKDSPDETSAQDAAVGADIGDWHAFVGGLGLTGMAAQLANNCTIEQWDGRRLALHVDPGCSSLIGSLAEQRLQQAIGDALRQPIQLKLAAQRQVEESPARRAAREAQERQTETEARIAADPVVLAMEETFDAEIVSGSVRRVDQPE